MSPGDRATYDLIEAFIAEFPYPMRGTNQVAPFRWYTEDGFRYFRDDFPYTIFYVVDEHEITIVQVLKSATSRTPL